MSKLTRVRLTNFTAFASFDHELSPGVTVIIGANGTGKTHLLKLLYASCAITTGEDQDLTYVQKLLGVFNPHEGRIGRLARRAPGTVNVSVSIERQGGTKISANFENRISKNQKAEQTTGRKKWGAQPLASAYIPVKEMLAHAPGFLSTVSRRELSFEDVYSDILKLAYLPILKGAPDLKRKGLLDPLQRAIQGKVVVDGEHFFLRNKQGNLEFTLLAEGMRKLALIWLLIQNGTLGAGSVLFWDEPEANLNPSLMGQLVDVILELQRQGVQVVLATHNHVLLKEFDLRKKNGDNVQYLSLYRGDSGAVENHVSDSFAGINPNLIEDTFNDLYDREISRSLRLDRK